jgi:hypothetical protein
MPPEWRVFQQSAGAETLERGAPPDRGITDPCSPAAFYQPVDNRREDDTARMGVADCQQLFL